MRLVLGSDHYGFELKAKILPELQKKYEIVDFGCYSADPVDFPDVARQVCNAVLASKADKGIMFCGSGVGAVIACNKVKGIRACLCHDVYTAHQCVEHDNVQLIAMGSQIVGSALALELIDVFVDARFTANEDFERRIGELEEMNDDR